MTATVPQLAVGDDVQFCWPSGDSAYGTVAALVVDEDGAVSADVTWRLSDGHPSSEPHRLPLHLVSRVDGLADAIECGECGALYRDTECTWCWPDPLDNR